MSGSLGGGGNVPYLLYESSWGSGVAATPSSYAASAWRTIGLNLEAVDTDGNGTLASNAITLLAGTYEFNAGGGFNPDGVAAQVGIRLRNTTDSITESRANTYCDDYGYIEYTLRGRFTIAAAKAFELQVYTDTIIYQNRKATTGENEVYHTLNFRKVG
jgi:hypothetical protein